MNIFNIWEALGQKTPFVARRNTWSSILVIVDKVEPNGKGYGVAYGRIYHKDSGLIEPYKKIDNSGTYSWIYEGENI